MRLQVLGTQEFYTQEADYNYRVDPTWDEEGWQAQIIAERETLGGVLGDANGHSVLDCSCGSGEQAIPLARRRALRKAELEQFLKTAGFGEINFLPHPNPRKPYEVVASL